MHPPDTPWNDGAIGAAPATPGGGTEDCDVCVVGAGIAGLTTAYLLARAGKRVLVLDAGAIGGGETRRTSAHLASALDDRFAVLERLHGERGARLAAESHAAAIDFIERLCREHAIRCDFRRVDGFLVSADGSGTGLAAEMEAAGRAGLAPELLPAVPGLEAWSGPAIRFPRQARFEPLDYLRGLAQACRSAGVPIRIGARVEGVSDGDPAIVRTADGDVRAGAVVVATNVPMNDRVVLQTKLEAHRSYVIALRIPAGGMPDALVWDDGDPYHYLRLVRDAEGALLVVGGEDHRTGDGPADADAPHRALEAWARRRFPDAGAVEHAWSGQIIEPVDSLACIGRNPGDRNVYVITGDSGNGLTHGTLGGMLLCDEIRGTPNAWAELYRPSRVTLRAAAEYAAWNASTIARYGDWLQVADMPVDRIASGEGAVVREGLHLVAAHRDAHGRLHRCSAVCPHLGGVVRWNAMEGTWDCPCHGSRFTPSGAVLNGPANGPLAPARSDAGTPTVDVLAL